MRASGEVQRASRELHESARVCKTVLECTRQHKRVREEGVLWVVAFRAKWLVVLVICDVYFQFLCINLSLTFLLGLLTNSVVTPTPSW